MKFFQKMIYVAFTLLVWFYSFTPICTTNYLAVFYVLK